MSRPGSVNVIITRLELSKISVEYRLCCCYLFNMTVLVKIIFVQLPTISLAKFEVDAVKLCHKLSCIRWRATKVCFGRYVS